MAEIGSRLREARVRRGLQLADVEATTKIRARYLAALEDDRFHVLPDRAYARVFLRSYAHYLGLEEQLLVEELDARFPPEEASVELVVGPRRQLRIPSPSILLPLAAGLLLAGLLAAGEFGSSTPSHVAKRSSRAPHAQARPHLSTTPTRPRRVTPVPKQARVVLTATRGNCWLLVRVESDAGPVLYENTLTRGQSVTFTRRVLWIRLGAPGEVDATLNGRPIATLPRNDSPANLLVSPKGAQLA